MIYGGGPCAATAAVAAATDGCISARQTWLFIERRCLEERLSQASFVSCEATKGVSLLLLVLKSFLAEAVTPDEQPWTRFVGQRRLDTEKQDRDDRVVYL